MPATWSATPEIWELLEQVKNKHHQRLEAAEVAVALVDSKPFVKDRFNWGQVVKFSTFNKIWMKEDNKYNFCIQLCADVWQDILNNAQREALLDLHLTRCDVEYMPEVVVENGKKIVVKDQWGRSKYTNEVKVDENGEPKWLVAPLDLQVFTQNIKRYGLWCEELAEMKEAITAADAVV